MEELFLKLVNLSITATYLVLFVIVLRLVLKKTPKWIFCVLWGLVALRLLCPVSIESMFSLVPSGQPIPQNFIYTAKPQIASGLSSIDNAINPILAAQLAPTPGASVNPTQVLSFLLSRVWFFGLCGMLVYGLISWWALKRRLRTATRLEGNIRQSEFVEAPFVLGLLRPVIYLPYRMDGGDVSYVIAHEQAHIQRKDHVWKPLGFLLLSIYWFNPVLWVAYVLLCRDIEAACDERVIRNMEQEDIRAYSTALLNCSIRRRRIAACPLAFGEVRVKERIQNVMRYKKPAVWLVAVAVIACIVASVCFLTDPPKAPAPAGTNSAGGILDLDLEEAVSQAILAYHKGRYLGGDFACESHVVLATEGGGDAKENRIDTVTVYASVLYQEYSLADGKISTGGGSHVPTALTFAVDENGRYTLTEYWEPRDGSYYAPDIRDKFPRGAAQEAIDTDRYILGLMQSCYAQAVEYGKLDTNRIISQLLTQICSSPAQYSDPGSYINEHYVEYRELLYYGEYTLRYIFRQFLNGGQTDLKGHIMRSLMDALAPELAIQHTAPTGQAYFNAVLDAVVGAQERHGDAWMQAHMRHGWMLIQMLESSTMQMPNVDSPETVQGN